MNNKTISLTLLAIGFFVASALTFWAVSEQSLERLAINSLVAWIFLSACLVGAYKIYGEKQ